MTTTFDLGFDHDYEISKYADMMFEDQEREDREDRAQMVAEARGDYEDRNN